MVIRFKIYNTTGYYFKCSVFDTKKEMYEYYLKYKGISDTDFKNGKNDRNKFGFAGFDEKLNFAAIVMPYERLLIKKGSDNKRMKDIGEALFYRNKLGAGLVAHECLHMAMWHDRLIERNEDATYSNAIGDAEERLAYCLTEFVRKFTIACYKHGIYA